jgi:signal transduction histidine kinase
VEVYRTGVTYNNGHNADDPTQLRGVWEGMGAQSSLDVVVEVAGARRGVLQVDAARPDAFSAEDQRFLEAVARWVGMVAHRAELSEQVAREAAAQARRVAADELIDILAHDLRTPLTPARGYLDLLRHRALADGREPDVRYADQIALAHARLRRMIDALLDAGRLEQGLFALEVRPVNLAALVEETVETLRTPEADLTVRGPGELVAEQVDPERLRQALENLVSNALAHAEGTPVVVEVAEEQRAEGAWAVLRVRDAGPGIAPDVLPTLFARFARGTHSSGLGLGLYLARGIAEAHGGTLTVESRLGAGTTFHLALPLAGAAPRGRRRGR